MTKMMQLTTPTASMLRRVMFAAAAASVLLLVLGCEPLLPERPPSSSDAGVDGGVDAGPPPLIITTEANGVYASLIDATADEGYAALDFDSATEVPFTSSTWDIAFQRFHIRVNGGAGGAGTVEVMPLPNIGFDDITQVPMGGQWLVDQPDGADENEELDTVFEIAEPWFSYSLKNHVLTPAPNVYLVKTDMSVIFKVKLERYYDESGTPAVISMKWAKLQ